MRLHPPLTSRTRSTRPRAVLTALIAAVIATGTALAAPTAQAATATTPAAGSNAGQVAGTSTSATYLLPTGDLVHRIGTGAGARFAFVPTVTSGPAAGLRTLRAGTTTMVYPRAAAPYLGHELDPGLFALTASAKGRLA